MIDETTRKYISRLRQKANLYGEQETIAPSLGTKEKYVKDLRKKGDITGDVVAPVLEAEAEVETETAPRFNPPDIDGIYKPSIQEQELNQPSESAIRSLPADFLKRKEYTPETTTALPESTKQPLDPQKKRPNILAELASLPKGLWEGLTVQLPEAIGGSAEILNQVLSKVPLGEISAPPAGAFGIGSPEEKPEDRKKRLESTYKPEESPLRQVSTDLLAEAYEKREELAKNPPANQFLYDLGQGASTLLTAFTTAIPATIAAGPVGGFVAGLGTTAMLEGGLAFSDARQYGLSEKDAAYVGLAVGGINGVLEMIPVSAVLKKAGFGRAISKEIAQEIVNRGLYKNIAKLAGEQAKTEAITEFAQELTSLTTESIYKRVEDRPELKDWLERSGYSALLGGILGGLTGIGGGVIQSRLKAAEEEKGEPLNEVEINSVIDELVRESYSTEGKAKSYYRQTAAPGEITPPVRDAGLGTFTITPEGELSDLPSGETVKGPSEMADLVSPEDRQRAGLPVTSEPTIEKEADKIKDLAKKLAIGTTDITPEETILQERYPNLLNTEISNYKNSPEYLEQKRVERQEAKQKLKSDADDYAELSRQFNNARRNRSIIDENELVKLTGRITTPEIRQKTDELLNEVRTSNERIKRNTEFTLENLSRKKFGTRDLNSLTDDQQQIVLNEYNEMKAQGVDFGQPEVIIPKLKEREVQRAIQEQSPAEIPIQPETGTGERIRQGAGEEEGIRGTEAQAQGTQKTLSGQKEKELNSFFDELGARYEGTDSKGNYNFTSYKTGGTFSVNPKDATPETVQRMLKNDKNPPLLPSKAGKEEIKKVFDKTQNVVGKVSSTQVNLPEAETKPFIEYANEIPEKELYTEEEGYGRETEPHVTALYGLKTKNPKDVEKVVKEFGDVEFELGKTSLFKQDKYDVLKVDVKSNDLKKLNKTLRDNLDYKSDFPDYTPHLTIAYLKPGEGEKYVGDNRFEGKKIKLSELLFSDPDYAKTPIALKSSPETPETGQGKAISPKQSIITTLEPQRKELEAKYGKLEDLTTTELRNITKQSLSKQDENYSKNIPGKEKASQETKSLKTSSIKTDEDRFQNRALSYAPRTVKAIVENYNPAKFDPIVVWRDPADNQVYVLSGHSRLEGMKRRKAENIPARYFKGTEQEAIEFARLEANRSATKEDLIEDIKAFNFAKEKKYTKKQFEELFPNGQYKALEDLSKLNPSGQFLSNLNSESRQAFPYLERNARWTGQLKSEHPEMTDAHEQEIFDFFYRGKEKTLMIKKEDFFNAVEKQINRGDFTPDQALMLETAGKTTGTRARADTADLQKEVDELLDRKKEAITDKERAAIDEKITKLKGRIQDIVSSQLTLLEERKKFGVENQLNLFDEEINKEPETPKDVQTPVNKDIKTVTPEDISEAIKNIYGKESVIKFENVVKSLQASLVEQDSPIIKPLRASISINDISQEVAERAFNNTTHFPEKRGARERLDYVGGLNGILDNLVKEAKTDEQLKIIADEFPRLKDRYKEHILGLLYSHSGIASSFITGGSNFPARQMEKRNNAWQNKYEKFRDFESKAIASINRKIRNQNIEDQGGEYEITKRRLEKAEKSQERMKAANTIIRNKKLSDSEKVEILKSELNMSEGLAVNLLKPNMGQTGFETFQLTNNNNLIKRLKEKLATLEKKEVDSTKENSLIGKFEGGEVINNFAEERVQISFDSIPDEAMRRKLKGNGWRWSPRNKVWQRQNTPQAVADAKRLLGIPLELKQAPEAYGREGAGELTRLKDYKKHLELSIPELEKAWFKFHDIEFNPKDSDFRQFSLIDYSRTKAVNDLRNRYENYGDAPAMRLIDAKLELYKTTQALNKLQKAQKKAPELKGQEDIFAGTPEELFNEKPIEELKPVTIKKDQLKLFEKEGRFRRSTNDVIKIFGGRNAQERAKTRITGELESGKITEGSPYEGRDITRRSAETVLPEYEKGVTIPKRTVRKEDRLVLKKFAEEGGINFVGLQLGENFIQDIADAAYIVRNPFTESGVVIGRDKNNKIIANIVMSSDASNYFRFSPGQIEEIAKTLKGRGAVRATVLHNHPSGNPNPSREDVHLSVILRQLMRLEGINLDSSVVINGDKYSAWMITDQDEQHPKMYEYKSPRKHPLDKFYKEFDSFPRLSLGSDTAPMYFSQLKYGNGNIAIVAVDNENRVRGYEYIHKDLLKDGEKFGEYVDEVLKSHAGAGIFIVGEKEDIGLGKFKGVPDEPGMLELVEKKKIKSEYSHTPVVATIMYKGGGAIQVYEYERTGTSKEAQKVFGEEKKNYDVSGMKEEKPQMPEGEKSFNQSEIKNLKPLITEAKKYKDANEFQKQVQQTINHADQQLGRKYKYELGTARIRQIVADNVPTEPEQLKKIASIKKDIKAGKGIPPVVVDIRMGDDKTPYEMVDGNHRLQAYRELGITEIPILKISEESEKSSIKGVDNFIDFWNKANSEPSRTPKEGVQSTGITHFQNLQKKLGEKADLYPAWAKLMRKDFPDIKDLRKIWKEARSGKPLEMMEEAPKYGKENPLEGYRKEIKKITSTQEFTDWINSKEAEFEKLSDELQEQLGEILLERRYQLVNNIEPEELTALNKAEIKSLREEFELDKLEAPKRRSVLTTLNNAKEQNIKESALDLAEEIIREPRQISDTEHAGMVMKAKDLRDEINSYTKDIADLIKKGDRTTARSLRAKADSMLDQLDKLTTASDRAGTEIGRALNIRKMRVKGENYDLASVLQRAVAAKGGRLTEEQRTNFEELTEKLSEAESEIERLKAAQDKLLLEKEKLLAKRIADREIRTSKVRQRAATAREKILKERSDIKKQLAGLGFRLNDVTGISAEGSYLVGKLAINYIHEGAVNLNEVVQKVLADLPDLTERDVWKALNSTDPARKDKMEKEVTRQVRQIKRQARLLADIQEAEEGVFRETRKQAPLPEDIKQLRQKLTALRKEAFRSQIEAQKLEKALQTINELQDQLENHYRAVKKKRPVESEELQITREKIKELRKALNTEDILADLQEQLQTGNFKIKEKVEPKQLPPELEKKVIEANILRKRIKTAILELQPKTGWEITIAVMDNLRTMRATLDMSAALRQGFFPSVRRPGLFAETQAQAMKAFFSEYSYEQIENNLKSNPNYFLMQKAGLDLTEIEGAIAQREEMFYGNFVEKIPIYGEAVKASNRHMVTTLNLIRAGVFNEFVQKYPNATTEELKAWADYVNVSTGRGNLGKYAQAGRNLSTVFFAPKFAVSRIQTPFMLFKHWENPRVRKEIAKDYAAFGAFSATAIALAVLAGAATSFDPDDPDFLKIVIGNTRIDLFAGIQQPVRLLLRIGKVGTDKAGLTEAAKRTETPLEMLYRFSSYKLAPTISIPHELLTGKTMVGEEREPWETGIYSITPMVWEDTYDAYQDGGVTKAAWTTALNFYGMSTNTYEKKKKASGRKPKSSREKLSRW